MNHYLALIMGVVFAGAGGELFVRGSVGLANWARISPGIVGATVAAFATSSPELTVAVNSALAGEPEISFGDALGSNVLNVALILASALLISGIQSPRASIKRDFPVALLAPVVVGMLFFDGVFSRADGILVLCMFFVWFGMTVVEARRQRSASEEVLGEHRKWLAVILCLIGFASLVAAGRLIVYGARGIALSFGIDEFVIGATVVAVGTSAPELATTIVAKVRGHDEVGLGTIVGSNIFNGLFIVPIAAIICPIKADLREAAVALIIGFLAVALTYPSRSGLIERKRGIILLALYAVYLAAIV